MVHIFPHWNWQGQEGTIVNVWAYSNCDQVELFLNNRSLGIKTRPEGQAPFNPKEIKKEKQKIHAEHIEWKVPYEAGTLRVEGLKSGKVVASQEIHTTKKPYKIELSYMMDQFVDREKIPELVADGRDIVIVKAVIMDEEDNVVPMAANLVNFSIEGDAQIIGVGNGNINSHEPNKANYRLAYNGLCAVIIQSSNKVGQFTLKAESDGLNSDAIEIKTVSPVATSIGVTTKPHSISSNYETSVITAEVRDKFGIVIPSSEKNLIFKLKGPALFENEEKEFEFSAIDGKATVKVKSTDQTGEAHITVFSEGLISGKVNLLIR